MAAYRHGVFTREIPTGLVPVVRVDSALPVVVGTAPVHNLEGHAPINEPRLIFTMTEFVDQFGGVGEQEDTHDFTLSEFAEVYLGTYGVGPIVCVNVFDPEKHVTTTSGDNPTTTPDVKKVKASDVIGGIDSTTLKKTGLELVAEVFPRFRMVPGQLLAPGFSGEPDVAVALGAKAALLNGHFMSHAIIDVPGAVSTYTEVPEWLNDNNLIDPSLIAFFGSPVLGDAVQHGSTHLAAAMAVRDAQSGNIPYWSPSNSRILANGMSHNGEALFLDNEQAQWLNGNGVVTGLNFTGGLKAWGNRTTAYPGSTDPKDTFIPIRRMFNWIANTLVLTAWERVDMPVRRRAVESVVDTFQIWLNGLTAREYILGGRVAFLAAENPTTDLMDGIMRFHLYIAPPPPAREIEFILEYDPTYFATLFTG